MTRIDINEKGQKLVVIDELTFKGKRKIDWAGVAVS